jgi:hypothetical protein
MVMADLAYDRSYLLGEGLHRVFAVFRAWEVSEDDQMILLGIDDIYKMKYWKRNRRPLAHLPEETLQRASYLLEIYENLHAIFNSPELADSWPKQPNREYGGMSGLDMMKQGLEGLRRVRNRLAFF